MSTMHRAWTDRLSDYLSDELDGAERSELERHLAECGPCRGVLEELRGVVSRARGLEEVRPERDLWPGIAAAIGSPVRAERDAGAAVIALPTGRTRTAEPAADRFAFTAPQLAAAAIVLVAASVLTTWWAGPGLGVRAAATTPAADTDAVSLVAMPAPPEGLSEELATLEQVLDAARERLDANTVRVLERNLAVIEQAIADSRRALALDPENEFLAHHLERVYERKIDYLRDAARVIDLAG